MLDLLSRILGLRHMKPLPVFLPAHRLSVREQQGPAAPSEPRRQQPRGIPQAARQVPYQPEAWHSPGLLICLSSPHQIPGVVTGIKGKLAKFSRLVFSVWRNGRTTNCVRSYSRSSTVGRTRISRRKMADQHCCQCSMPTRHMWKVWVVLIRNNTAKEASLSMNMLG